MLETPYHKAIDRHHPSCVVVMVDQSSSMKSILWAEGEDRVKADAVADCVNVVLADLLEACTFEGRVENLFYVSVVGYGEEVAFLLNEDGDGKLLSMDELLQSVVKRERRQRTLPDGSYKDCEMPIWVEPKAGNSTPMCQAFRLTREVVADFLRRQSDCFPPVVINITDGASGDGSPILEANQLKEYSSTNGNVLLFNVHISSSAAKTVAFPHQESMLGEVQARDMFHISSVLPEIMIERVRKHTHYVPEPGARGLICNGELADVSKMLNLAVPMG